MYCYNTYTTCMYNLSSRARRLEGRPPCLPAAVVMLRCKRRKQIRRTTTPLSTHPAPSSRPCFGHPFCSWYHKSLPSRDILVISYDTHRTPSLLFPRQRIRMHRHGHLLHSALKISCAVRLMIPPVTGKLVHFSRYKSISRAACRPSLMPLRHSVSRYMCLARQDGPVLTKQSTTVRDGSHLPQRRPRRWWHTSHPWS